MTETAIYIHIPFCEHKCIYCDFYSVTPRSKSEQYLKVLKKEIEYYSKQYAGDREIVSVYFGGGTPSLMEPGYIGEIIQTVKNNFHVSSSAEVTLETNPGTVNKRKFEEFLQKGVNRISIGIQSFSDKDLKFLTRIHDSSSAEKTVFYALDAGFENINIDLIFNLPNQSKEKWSKNLERAIALPIKHISAYSLILEPGTILNKMVLDGKVQIQGEDTDAELYEYTINLLERHGFHQYEISNFSKDGYECIHNNIYWHYKDYLSFGTSAHSFVNKRRWWNFTGLTFYLNAMAEKGHAVAGAEQLTDEQVLQEYVMLALRSSGLMLTEFTSLFGQQWIIENEKKLVLFMNEGLIKIDSEKIKLTKKGYTLCDEILTQLN
jgi:oxygen-independent coproporphyrinogen III oxidase